MSTNTAVLDVTLENFESDVVVASRTKPILIDFWATWCAPCKTLGPILEKLAREAEGRFTLAKIDIDRTPELAEAFGIQSVPTVILMKGARPVDGFMGALPEAQVKKFLDKHLPPPPVDALAEAKKLDAAGRRDDAIQVLREHLRERHDDGAARLLLAKLLVDAGKVEEARLVEAKLTDAERASADGLALARALEFSKKKGELDALAGRLELTPEDLALQMEYGKALVAAGEQERGLQVLWRVAERDLRFEGGAPRKALVEVFDVLGFEHPLVAEYQRRLSILLCP
ncbi:MAG: thioredoxin [Planctomycetes bacterium]|nr:thioredoxin [Planctomycetota bacterium]